MLHFSVMLYALEQPCKKNKEEIDMNLPQETFLQEFPPIFVSHFRIMSFIQTITSVSAKDSVFHF